MCYAGLDVVHALRNIVLCYVLGGDINRITMLCFVLWGLKNKNIVGFVSCQ